MQSTIREKRSVGKTVLVVDDNAPVRKMLVAAFLSDGFTKCEQAENGEEAIKLAKQVEPDLIILDLSMPVMNGLDAAVELRKLFPEVPLILFTMYDNSAVAAAASKVGINVVLSKGVDLSTLTDEAHKLIA